MLTISVRRLLTAAWLSLGLLVPLAATPAVAAEDAVYTGRFSDLAVSGYDPVAYFTAGKPVEGSSDLEYQWNGATWRFSTPANLAAFKADPDSYAPQYGGYCAWAVSQGYTASSDPMAWRIHDARLYLNYSAAVQATWVQDIPGHIAKADSNWPRVLEK
jgi:YHS domain-containing protein